MRRICELILVGFVLMLVVSGLNTSNEAINQLTASERPPVIAIQPGPSQIDIQWAGEHFVISTDKLYGEPGGEPLTLKSIYTRVAHYLHKIWVIFEVIFLS